MKTERTLNRMGHLMALTTLALGLVASACDSDDGGNGNGTGGAAAGGTPTGGTDVDGGAGGTPTGGTPTGGSATGGTPTGGTATGGTIEPDAAAPLPSIAEIAQADDRFETLVQAAVAAGLVETLAGDTELTVFAPTDEAFAALPAGTLDTLLADADALRAVLTFHAVAGTHLAAEVSAAQTLPSVQGSPLHISVADGVVSVEQAHVIQADVLARNGVIHVIDGVLVPPADEPPPAPGTIVDIAVSNPDFETLVAAVTAAGLVETLSGEGPFTVFAPTDDAFAALPAGTVEALLEDIPTLTDILTYHVIAGEVPAAQVVAAASLTMLNGDTAEITLTDGHAYIDGAEILVTDIPASNGIIHVLGGVMLPPQ